MSAQDMRDMLGLTNADRQPQIKKRKSESKQPGQYYGDSQLGPELTLCSGERYGSGGGDAHGRARAASLDDPDAAKVQAEAETIT